MFRGPIKFYLACVRRAFAGWFGKVSGWAGTLALLISVGLLFIAPPPPFDKIAPTAEPTFFVAAFSVVLVIRLLLAPYWLYRDERVARELLEQARRPRLLVRLPDPPVLREVWMGGSTSESLAGTRQTVINRAELDVVALICTNKGETEAEGCRARILSVARVGEDGAKDLGVVESIALPWDKRDPEGSHSIKIHPAESGRIWLGGVRSRGNLWIFRDIKALPLEYQQLLGKPGTYRVLLQIDARNVPPQQIELEIVAAEGPPVQNGIQRGVLSVRITAQGAPRIPLDPGPSTGR